MSVTHAKLSPSAASRWFACPGSPQLIATLPASAFKTSPYAAEGTVAHRLAEEFITGKLDMLALAGLSGTRLGCDGLDVDVTDAMVEGVVEYADAVEAVKKRFTKPGKVTIEIEARIKVDVAGGDVWGTADYIAYQKGHELHVLDFKYGKTPVVAEENLQGLIYLVAAQDSGAGKAFNKCFFHIIQPRAGGHSPWELPLGRLEAFRKELATHVAATEEPNAPRAAGSWCRFCPALAFCPEAAAGVQAVARVEFALPIVSIPSPATFTASQLARALDWEDAVDSWFEAVRARALEELMKDRSAVPGYKLVEGRSNRIWGDEKEVESAFALLGDNLYEPKKILSPSKLEKVIGKEEVARWAIKPPGKPTVTRENDKRQELPTTSVEAKQVFASANSIWP